MRAEPILLGVLLAALAAPALADEVLLTARDLVREARAQITEVDAYQAYEMMGRALFIDLREDHEWAAGHIPDAVHYSRGLLEFRVGRELDDPDQLIVVYCAAGLRSALAAKTLEDMGFSNVVSLRGGVGAWRDADLPMTDGGHVMAPHH